MTVNQRQPGSDSFYTISNGQIYNKVMEMEKQLTKIATTFSVVAFIVSPVVSILAVNIINTMMGK